MQWQGIVADHSAVRAAYQHQCGHRVRDFGTKDRDEDFAIWCANRVVEWKERTDALGYSWPCWCIGNVATGTQTYHEWLKERVGM